MTAKRAAVALLFLALAACQPLPLKVYGAEVNVRPKGKMAGFYSWVTLLYVKRDVYESAQNWAAPLRLWKVDCKTGNDLEYVGSEGGVIASRDRAMVTLVIPTQQIPDAELPNDDLNVRPICFVLRSERGFGVYRYNSGVFRVR